MISGSGDGDNVAAADYRTNAKEPPRVLDVWPNGRAGAAWFGASFGFLAFLIPACLCAYVAIASAGSSRGAATGLAAYLIVGFVFATLGIAVIIASIRGSRVFIRFETTEADVAVTWHSASRKVTRTEMIACADIADVRVEKKVLVGASPKRSTILRVVVKTKTRGDIPLTEDSTSNPEATSQSIRSFLGLPNATVG